MCNFFVVATTKLHSINNNKNKYKEKIALVIIEQKMYIDCFFLFLFLLFLMCNFFVVAATKLHSNNNNNNNNKKITLHSCIDQLKN